MYACLVLSNLADIYTLTNFSAFLKYLSPSNVAKMQAMVRAEFIDKLKLQVNYSAEEKIQIMKIIETVSLLSCQKSGIAIYQKDAME